MTAQLPQTRSRRGVGFHQLFSHVPSHCMLVKAQIAHPSVIIEVQEGARELFIFTNFLLKTTDCTPVNSGRVS